MSINETNFTRLVYATEGSTISRIKRLGELPEPTSGTAAATALSWRELAAAMTEQSKLNIIQPYIVHNVLTGLGKHVMMVTAR